MEPSPVGSRRTSRDSFGFAPLNEDSLLAAPGLEAVSEDPPLAFSQELSQIPLSQFQLLVCV